MKNDFSKCRVNLKIDQLDQRNCICNGIRQLRNYKCIEQLFNRR